MCKEDLVARIDRHLSLLMVSSVADGVLAGTGTDIVDGARARPGIVDAQQYPGRITELLAAGAPGRHE
jgi:hypothetical protein